MRRIVLLALSTVVFGGTQLAFAADEMIKPPRKDCDLELRCRFIGDGAKKYGNNYCTARAKIEDRDHNGHGPMEAERERERHRDRNRLAVECNGQTIYADGAHHKDFGGFEFLIGQGGNPVIKFASERHRHDKDDASIVTAWLSVNGFVLEGLCAIEREKDHHRP